MSYTVLARRYRSQSFDEVVGQEAIARTLRQALATNRVGHAYLFCGTRGVGKTTMARLLARELAGGSAEADAAILAGQDTDVIEIDGASNNRVEEARELIANCVYLPLRGRRKVYIIDEVHMLTTQAFNALLKTMEEPPSHVVFILCTTEPHKVPATIQSRCQRFDFRPIPTPRIAEHLGRVAAGEGVEADVDLLHAVARLGNGSMRDALSVLERLLATGERRLTMGLLTDLLGLPDRELISGILDACAEGDVEGVLERGGALLRQGAAIEDVLESLLGRLRDLLVLAVCGVETELVELGEAARREEAERAARFEPAALVHMIAVCESVQMQVRRSAVPRALFDATLARLAMTDRLAELTALAAGRENAGGAASKKR